MKKLLVPLLGGAALVLPAALAAGGDHLDAVVGKSLFERYWVEAPASTTATDGLGPLFNERACALCHVDAGGSRFAVLDTGEVGARGLVARLGSRDGIPDPRYGHQIQNNAVAGLDAEGIIRVRASGTGDDERLSYALDLREGPLGPHTAVSYRQAPPLTGRADIARISTTAIMVGSDPDDRDGDGISGRVRLLDYNKTVGRFGWKGATRSLETQIAAAFATDIGLSTPAMPFPHGDCTRLQTACLAAPTGIGPEGGAELGDDIVRMLAAFIRELPRPAAADDPAGAALFADTGCAACHRPTMPDGQGNPVRVFTDLLLHDMGPELDDGVGETGVASSEWRTAPLIAMTDRAGLRRYLHDGRAGTIAAAVAAHGGEGAAARERFQALGEVERGALIRYVESL